MYFGSVKFFKHLIIMILALVLVLPTASCIFWGTSYFNLKKDYESLATLAQVNIKTEINSNQKMDQEDRLLLPYQKKYPELYVENEPENYHVTDIDTIFLTFDDGPSNNTKEILKILGQENIKATFFVTYTTDPENRELLKLAYEKGHTIGVHSANHVYAEIYDSVENYIDDFAKASEMIEEITGVKPTVFRFPGGSVNTYNQKTYKEIIAEMVRRGYTYYDWNVSSGDASRKADSQSIYNNVINGIYKDDYSIVLMHDGKDKDATVKALENIINELKKQGYKFEALDNGVKPVQFGYINT